MAMNSRQYSQRWRGHGDAVLQKDDEDVMNTAYEQQIVLKRMETKRA